MFSKLLQRLADELPGIAYNALGVALVAYALIWLVYSIVRIMRHRNDARFIASSIGLMVINAMLLVGFLALTASTDIRPAYINLPMYEIATTSIQTVLGLTGTLIVSLSIYTLARRFGGVSAYRFAVVATLGAVALIAGAGVILFKATYRADYDEIQTDSPALAAIKSEFDLPVQVFTEGKIERPTAMALGPDGRLYVASFAGSIWAVDDADADGRADDIVEFAHGLHQPEGLLWLNGGLYVTAFDELLLLKDTNDDGVADMRKVILGGMPGEQYALHQTNGLTLSPEGRILIGVGSTSDHDEEKHPLAARILSINPDGSDLKVFASGLRNPFGITPAPGGGFFVTDNGASGCMNASCTKRIEMPEEVNYVVEGRDYGFPHYFGMPPEGTDTEAPMLSLPDHGSPAGLVVYTGDGLPSSYAGRLFICMWARNEIISAPLQRVNDRTFLASSRVFASGVPAPSAIINSPNGGLYVASFAANTIYHFGRVADMNSAAATP